MVVAMGTYVNVATNGLNFKRFKHRSILLLEKSKYDQSMVIWTNPCWNNDYFQCFQCF